MKRGDRTKELVGKRIKESRRAKKMTQEELAEKTNISAKYLSSIERGLENPTFDTIIKLACALDVDVPELFNYPQHLPADDLMDYITGLLNHSDEKKLRLAAKILKALCM